MRKYITVFLISFMLIGCAIKKNVSVNQINASFQFNYDHVNSMNADGEIILDKPFTIELPAFCKKREDITGGWFIHIFNYEKNEKIVLIYEPGYHKTDDGNSNYLNIAYKDFIDLIDEKEVSSCFENVRMLKRRSFGLRTIGKDHFYAIYLNVTKRDVEIYNRSIASLELK